MKITLYSGFGYWAALGPNAPYRKDRMIGGGETGLVNLSMALGKRGHDVTVIADVAEEGRHSNVNWVQWEGEEIRPEWRAEPCDVFIACDQPTILANAPDAKLRILDCQNNHFMIRHVLPYVDLVVARSRWHADVLADYDNNIKAEECLILPNGVDASRFKGPTSQRNPKRVFYSSSPDRGLHHLATDSARRDENEEIIPGIWERVIKEVPDAELHVYYDVTRWFEKARWDMRVLGNRAWAIASLIGMEEHELEALPGVTYHGPTDQRTLARHMRQSNLLLYPCDTMQPTEGFCITIAEALLAGCGVITTDCDALPELWGNWVTMLPLPVAEQEELWASAIVRLMLGEEADDDGTARAHWLPKWKEGQKVVRNKLTWDAIAEVWENTLAAKLMEKSKAA
jgi:glycosyltransferase involved in cell wall biosynthesis